jgi:large subunit ribosomal protein L20
MARTKGGVKTRRRHKRWLKAAKGYWGRRKNLYRQARHTVQRALRYAWRDRKARKREFRRLWITRIAAAARQQGTSYSRLMGGLLRSDVQLDRKVLADLAVYDTAVFEKLVAVSREAAAR